MCRTVSVALRNASGRWDGSGVIDQGGGGAPLLESDNPTDSPQVLRSGPPEPCPCLPA
jgi:hypothetical protein